MHNRAREPDLKSGLRGRGPRPQDSPCTGIRREAALVWLCLEAGPEPGLEMGPSGLGVCENPSSLSARKQVRLSGLGTSDSPVSLPEQTHQGKGWQVVMRPHRK